jgi:ABC-type lipoprotein export system ATPase subunit
MPAAFAVNETFPAPADSPGPIARVVGVAKTYGRGETAIAALEDATLEIATGEVTLIEGPSGSGKTTLISILGLLLTPSASGPRCAPATSGSSFKASTCFRRCPRSTTSRSRSG